MTQKLRIRLWIIWAAFTLFVVGQTAYTFLFYGSVSNDLLDAYAHIDTQLSGTASFAKWLFGVCEAFCFAIALYTIREIAAADVKLNVAYGLYFALSMINVFDALFGQYYGVDGVKTEYAYALCVLLIATNEYNRYKNKRRGTNS